VEWNKYLDEIAKTKKMDVDLIKEKLVVCGKPGFTGATVKPFFVRRYLQYLISKIELV
jgi:hypothetical protein